MRTYFQTSAVLVGLRFGSGIGWEISKACRDSLSADMGRLWAPRQRSEGVPDRCRSHEGGPTVGAPVRTAYGNRRSVLPAHEGRLTPSRSRRLRRPGVSTRLRRSGPTCATARQDGGLLV